MPVAMFAWCVSAGRRFSGLIVRQLLAALNTCQAECDAVPQCSSWKYVNGGCSLQRGLQGLLTPVPDVDLKVHVKSSPNIQCTRGRCFPIDKNGPGGLQMKPIQK